MQFGKKDLYEQTRKIKIGRAKLSPIFNELKEWVNDEYGINVINIVYDEIDIGPHKRRPRLNLIVETYIPTGSYQTAISEKFAEIVKNAGLGKKYDVDDILVIYDDFSAKSIERASWQLLQHDKRHLMSEFSDIGIWDIVQSDFSAKIVIFYNSDDDVVQNDKNGNSERVKREFFRLIKQYDEFGYCRADTFPIAFDSKQNLDENYRGVLYYYFK